MVVEGWASELILVTDRGAGTRGKGTRQRPGAMMRLDLYGASREFTPCELQLLSVCRRKGVAADAL